MLWTFFGLETAVRGLRGQQAAINTTSHNIDNANTPGYTRQRVDLAASTPIEMPSLYKTATPGQIGTGVQVEQITRLRDQFLDDQYRHQNQYLGEWNVRQDALDKISAILNEPSDSGLATVMQNFWNAWGKLGPNSDDLAARMQVKQTGIAVAQTLNQTAKQLSDLDADLQRSLQAKVTEVNSYLNQIAALNNQIAEIRQVGDQPNDLLDQRDHLVDQLSQLVDVQATESGGTYTLTIGGQTVLQNSTVTALDPNNLTVGGGELKGLLEARQDVASYRAQLDAFANGLANGKMTMKLPGDWTLVGSGGAAPTFPVDVTLADGRQFKQGDQVPADLITTTLADGTQVATIPNGATVTVNGLNGLHRLGYSLNGPGGDFFVSTDPNGGPITAATIAVAPNIVSDVGNIASALTTAPQSGTDPLTGLAGDGALAIAVNNIKDAKIDYTGLGVATPLTNGTLDDYFQAVIGGLGVQSQEAERQVANQEVLVQQLDGKRQSVSGVSIDEEMANMIRFQQAYGASARMVTAIDQMLDKLINGTGVVGL
ncbi:flagellar hook-associated protein FlgK [Kyrpidia spormannii]|uniref:Flagellar hook-associated protein FlgK n=1 Tax=Kyrpidia spormannii TaxID=2055160 RepID=A0ACA8ZDM3_9BACL|nr:flagellar hook-associated protein FlgK [Kyrpidia spormannii]CAB3395137.1 Flagellar hook-associated protein FlgK [Kyrpidia spormannii]